MPFDVNRILIHSYEHLESDIGYSEVNRFQKHLKQQIIKFIKDPKVDSPIYTFLPKLNPLSFSQDDIEDIKESIDKSHSTADLVTLTEEKKNEGKFEIAKDLLKDALKNKPNDSFIIQRLALTTYKSKQPTEKKSLNEAINVLKTLNPKETTDPETLDPVHFGIIMILNLSIGLCTPPVGSVLFVGVGIAKTGC